MVAFPQSTPDIPAASSLKPREKVGFPTSVENEIRSSGTSAAEPTGRLVVDRSTHQVHPRTIDTQRRRSVDGVVSSVGPISILLSCKVGTEWVEIQIPTSLVPLDLQSFGQTVTVGLGQVGGYRAPQVTKRVAPADADDLSLQLDAWIESL